MSKKKQKPILADKINELLAPRSLVDQESDSDHETTAKAFDHDLDVEFEDDPSVPTVSSIRKKNIQLLDEVDEKYRGKIVSRKDLEMDSSESEDEADNDSDDETAIAAFSKKLKTPLGACDEESNEDLDSDEESGNVDKWDDEYEDEEIGEEEEDDEEEDDQEEEEEDDDDEADEEESDFDAGDMMPKPENNRSKQDYGSILPKKQTNDQMQKGACVQNQIQIWEKLLEIRIHSQKMMIKANSLPVYDKFNQLSDGNPKFSDLAAETEQNVFKLMSQMRELQSVLLHQYPETRDLSLKRKPSSDLDKIDGVDAKRQRLAEDLSEDFLTLKDYQYGVISKWHDRTKVLTPGSVKTQKQQGNIDIVQKIEGVLANKGELMKKSQLLKGGYTLFDQSHTIREPKANRTLGETETTENDPNDEADDVYCTEVYDDTDFYHTQLRELIEYKTNSSGNAAEMAKQFNELQKIRKKMKKTVDTRASKGRKIRYVVHNKLVSFMAPNDPGEWDDEQKSDLFRSLFGAQS